MISDSFHENSLLEVIPESGVLKSYIILKETLVSVCVELKWPVMIIHLL